MTTAPGDARRAQLREVLTAQGLDALVCTLPTNVLMLTGIWPVLGASVSIATRQGRMIVLMPSDEEEFAETGWADEVRTFESGSLDEIRPLTETIVPHIVRALDELAVAAGTVGFESGRITEPSSYVSMYLYGARMRDILGRAHDPSRLRECDEALERLRTIKTDEEVGRIARACDITARAFALAPGELRAGAREAVVAAAVRQPLLGEAIGHEGVLRADGFVFCMSGPNAARAYGAFGHNRDRAMREGDLVMVHCNSYADGYCTDVTRTWSLGRPDAQRRRMLEAVLEARDAALSMLRPGTRAADVDRAVREIIARCGFPDAMKHPTGHGVGFGSLDHFSRPFLHPASDDVLDAGMVFNVEPAVYVEGVGGVRHCDMVAVEAHGARLLTPFVSSIEELILA